MISNNDKPIRVYLEENLRKYCELRGSKDTLELTDYITLWGKENNTNGELLSHVEKRINLRANVLSISPHYYVDLLFFSSPNPDNWIKRFRSESKKLSRIERRYISNIQ